MVEVRQGRHVQQGDELDGSHQDAEHIAIFAVVRRRFFSYGNAPLETDNLTKSLSTMVQCQSTLASMRARVIPSHTRTNE